MWCFEAWQTIFVLRKLWMSRNAFQTTNFWIWTKLVRALHQMGPYTYWYCQTFDFGQNLYHKIGTFSPNFTWKSPNWRFLGKNHQFHSFNSWYKRLQNYFLYWHFYLKSWFAYFYCQNFSIENSFAVFLWVKPVKKYVNQLFKSKFLCRM